MYKKYFFSMVFCILAHFVTLAQDTSKVSFLESEVVPLADKKGIVWQARSGSYLFKPYVFIQTKGQFQYYDDEGLDLAEQDNILNSGFGIPYAIIGFSGKAFDRVTFNVALNPASSGGALLNQAWFDLNVSESLRFRIGKFKTPFAQAYLVRLGETLFPSLPSSLTTRVNLPFDINSLNPAIATGFDIGAQVHGLVNNMLEYQAGLFNGTGINVNTPLNSTSDDFGIPSLLYAGRIALMPKGPVPAHQGDPDDLDNNKILFALSSSYNVEANYESSNDFRAGFEFMYMKQRLYLAAESYLLNMDFTERQQISPNYLFFGGYSQAGYFVGKKLQPMLRFDLLDRNSLKQKGALYMSSAGVNYYLYGYNLKLQVMYQMLKKSGHADQFSADDDDNGMAEHMAMVLLQFSF